MANQIEVMSEINDLLLTLVKIVDMPVVSYLVGVEKIFIEFYKHPSSPCFGVVSETYRFKSRGELRDYVNSLTSSTTSC